MGAHPIWSATVGSATSVRLTFLRMGSGREDIFKQAEELYRRFHIIYDAAGVWRHARDGKRQLHVFDVEVGRALLAREGYTGIVQELHALAGSFDHRTHSALTAAA